MNPLKKGLELVHPVLTEAESFRKGINHGWENSAEKRKTSRYKYGHSLNLPEAGYMSPRLASTVIQGIQAGSWLRIHPFYWDEEKQLLLRKTDTLSITAWYANIGFAVSYLLLSIGWTIYAYFDENSTTATKVLLEFFLYLLVVPLVVQYAICFNGYEIPDIINHGCRLLKDFSEHTPPKLKPGLRYVNKVRYTEIFLTFTSYICRAGHVIFILLNILNPQLECFVSSILLDKTEYRSSVIILSTCVTIFHGNTILVGIYLFIFSGVGIRFPTAALLDALRDSDYSPRLKVKYYQQLSVFNGTMNRVFAPALLPLSEVIIIGLCTNGIVGAIRFKGVIGFQLGFVGFIAYAMLWGFFRISAIVTDSSDNLHRHWKRYNKLERRVLMSLRPIHTALGSYGFIDNGIILTATDIIISNTIGLLLAMEER